MSSYARADFGAAAAKVHYWFRSEPCLQMAGLTTTAATQSITCCECGRMLRQHWLHLHKAGLSA